MNGICKKMKRGREMVLQIKEMSSAPQSYEFLHSTAQPIGISRVPVLAIPNLE